MVNSSKAHSASRTVTNPSQHMYLNLQHIFAPMPRLRTLSSMPTPDSLVDPQSEPLGRVSNRHDPEVRSCTNDTVADLSIREVGDRVNRCSGGSGRQAWASSVKFRVIAGSTGIPGPVVVETVTFFR